MHGSKSEMVHAVALQKEASPAVVLQRRIYAEQMQLLDGRYEALRLDAGDEDEDDAEGAGAEVDTPVSRFSQRGCRLVEQQGTRRRGSWRSHVWMTCWLHTTSPTREWSREGRRRSGRRVADSSLQTGVDVLTGMQTSGVRRRVQRRRRSF